MSVLNKRFLLGNGAPIPALGFGTWQIPAGEEAYASVAAALTAGYRHIDTARAYGNEASVGAAITDSGLPRDDVFVTTKLPAEVKNYREAVDSFDESLAALGTGHIDLYLIHAPWPWHEMGADYATGNAEVWRALEEFEAAGLARAIGVSNFDPTNLEQLLDTAGTVPAVNQIKYHIGHRQAETVAYCQRLGIPVAGYSPLGTGRILDSATITTIADRYDATAAQLCIRYLIQNGIVALPKTTNATRMRQNADLDFEISALDMTALNALDGQRH